MNRFLIIGVLCAAGCGVGNPPKNLAQPDFDYFVCQVHPQLQATCQMAGCHGNEEMVFRVHSPGILRLLPPNGAPFTTSYRNANFLTREELTVDYNSIRGLIDTADPTQSPPLLKPLAASAGGSWHEGGVIYASTSDAAYQTLLQWINGATIDQLSPQDAQQCQNVLQRSLAL